MIKIATNQDDDDFTADVGLQEQESVLLGWSLVPIVFLGIYSWYFIVITTYNLIAGR